ncbi:MAG TPA: alkaline phosphatase family protein [bacterium]|nr:alkaline phosphatase family protein [bacterium]
MTATEKKKGKIIRAILVAAALAAFGAGAFLAWHQTQKGPSIVLVGMDALDWKILDPLLKEGKLPHFQALIDRGVHGELITLQSTYISASIWNTILTGKIPAHHGIHGFVTTQGFAFNSTARITKFLPQILSDQGIVTAAIGFWATWPADKISGYIVSDLASYGRFKDLNPAVNKNVRDYNYLKDIQRVTWPEDLLNEILPVMLSPGQVPRSVYERVLSMTDPRWEEFKKIEEVQRDSDLSLLKFSVVTDYNFHRAGLEIIRRHHPRAYMIYFQGPDIMEHFFWKYMEPEYFQDHVTPEQAQRFGEVIRNYYIFMDGLLGETMAAADKNALVVLCSDHGQNRVSYWGQDATHSGEHCVTRPPGVFIIAGPGVAVEPDKKISGPEVVDIAPTLLYLLGLPIGKDMDGMVAIQLVTDEFKKNHELRYIPTYDKDLERKEETFSPLDQEIKSRLRAIGYVD